MTTTCSLCGKTKDDPTQRWWLMDIGNTYFAILSDDMVRRRGYPYACGLQCATQAMAEFMNRRTI